jgi:hypothetical protein
MNFGFFKRRRSPLPASPTDTAVEDATISSVGPEKAPLTRGRSSSRVPTRDPFLVSFEVSVSQFQSLLTSADSHIYYSQHIDSHDPRKFTQGRKWLIILIALAVQFWANAISSMAAPAVETISSDLHVSTPAGRVIQAIYLYGVAVGAVVLTPLSEGESRNEHQHDGCLHTTLFALQTTADCPRTSLPSF